MQLYPVFLFIDTRVLLKHRAIGYQMILIAATRFLSRHPALGTDARFGVSTRWMTCIIWQRLRPWRRASPKAMHSLGFSAFALFVSPCAFWTLKLRSFRALGAFLGPSCRCQTQCHSATFRGSPLRRHTCTGKRWKCQGWDMCTTTMEYGSKLDTSSRTA